MIKEFYVIDRIENNIVVCESDKGEIIDINKEDLIDIIPKEGMVLEKRDNNYYYDKEETEKRKREIEKFMEEMWD